MLSHINILLIEDDTGDAYLVEEMLADQASATSIRITHVETLADALLHLQSSDIDVILLDLSLPDSFGLEGVARVREQAPYKPIVVLTGLEDEAIGLQAIRQGAQDFLFKGRIAGESLRRAVRYALERMQIEEASRISKERFQSIFNGAGIGIALVHLETEKVLDANPAFENMLGHRIEEIQEMSLADVMYTDDDTQRVSMIQEAIDKDYPVQQEQLYVRKDGAVIWGHTTTSLIRDRAGQPEFIVFMIEDITESKQAEAKINEQAALLDQAQDAIFVWTIDDELTYWNRSAERLLGWKAEDIVGQKADVTLFQRASPQLLHAYKCTIEQGHWLGQLALTNNEGQKVSVESRWTLVPDEHQLPKAILVVSTDIREKQELQTQFLRAQRMESVGALAGGIAHDLNNILEPIFMGVELLKMGDVSTRHLKYLTTIETSATRAANLVKQVLTFARGAEGEHNLLQLKHLIVEIQQILHETFARSIQIKTAVAQGLWPVMGDATQLHQVLMNLAINARDAMPTGGKLSIEAQNIILDEHSSEVHPDAQPGRYVKLTFSDTGSGIPPEVISRIFDPFFTTKELGTGTGLGLSTSLGIVKDHGGFITVESKPENGTTFAIHLPALSDPELEEQELATQSKRPNGNGRCILLVDDEEALLDLTKETLEQYNYQVIPAQSGPQAISLYVKHQADIDIVVTDMMMPVMDGAALISTLQNLNPEVKCIAASGVLDEDVLHDLGATEHVLFLSKPYTIHQLHDAIEEAT